MTEKKNVYISLHEAFVREGIQYTDRRTGEQRSFNVVRLPPDTVIDGRDVGGYEFSPLYVNPSRFRGEHWRDVPLLADREVRLSRSVLDAEGRPIVGEDGKREKETMAVMPSQIRDALSEARKRYAEENARDGRGLAERAAAAPFDERVAVMGLIVDATVSCLREAVMEEKAAAFAHSVLADLKERLAAEGVAEDADASALIRATTTELARTRDTERAASLLSDERYRSFERTISLLDEVLRTGADTPEGATFNLLRERFNERLDELDAAIDEATAALDNVFKFVEEAFGEGQEMLMLVTDLSVSRAGMAFINDHGCDRYFAHNQSLQFYERGHDLAARIDRITLEEE